MAREDFWKEVMLSWTLKDELESDTKEKHKPTNDLFELRADGLGASNSDG